MTTLVVFTACALLVIWALYRRPDATTVTVALSFVVAVALSIIIPGREVRTALAVLDAAVVLALLAVWAQWHSHRARHIAGIGLLKCAWAVPYTVFPYMNWNTYAAALNGAFVVQVLIAGGAADGIGAWIDRHARSVWGRWFRLRRDVVR